MKLTRRALSLLCAFLICFTSIPIAHAADTTIRESDWVVQDRWCGWLCDSCERDTGERVTGYIAAYDGLGFKTPSYYTYPVHYLYYYEPSCEHYDEDDKIPTISSDESGWIRCQETDYVYLSSTEHANGCRYCHSYDKSTIQPHTFDYEYVEGSLEEGTMFDERAYEIARHKAVCTLCGYAFSAACDDYIVVTPIDDTYHLVTCTKCYLGGGYGGGYSMTHDIQCGRCVDCGYETETVSHSSTAKRYVDYNATYHKTETYCKLCNTVTSSDLTAHTYTGSMGTCRYCGHAKVNSTGTLGEIPKDSTIYINENGKPVAFYVVKHDYESTLNGEGRTLLLRADVFARVKWDNTSAGNEDYSTSYIDNYLDTTYKQVLDSNVINAIAGTVVQTIINKDKATATYSVFLLSAIETGNAKYYDGEDLGISNYARAYEASTLRAWWTRTPYKSNTTQAYQINTAGEIDYVNIITASGVRPAFTLPADAYIVGDGTVKFYTNISWNVDGTITTTKQFAGDPLEFPTEPTKSGYEFLGWYTAASGGSPILSDATVPDAAVVYYARWAPLSTLEIDPAGGIWGGTSAVSTFTARQGVTLPVPKPTRTGYTFSKWLRTGNYGTLTSLVDDATYTFGAVANVTCKLTAQWTANTYTITWNDGSSESTSSQLYDASIDFPSAPSKTGHAFLGWFTDPTGGTEVTAGTKYTTAGNTTYYAHWQLNTSQLKVDPNGGTWKTFTTAQTYSQEYNTTLAVPNPSKPGYAFSTWQRTGTNGTLSGTTYTFGPTAGVTDTLKAQWTANTYNITWDTQGGSAVAKSTVTFNSAVGTLPTTTRAGYTLKGWYTAPSGGNSIKADSVYTTVGDSTYYAQWEANTYKITWDSQGGTAVASSNHIFGGTLGTLPSTTRTGYRFDGWYTAASGGTKISTTTSVPSANTTYYAHWTAETYTISWEPHGGSAVTSWSRAYASALGTLPTTSRTGHTFKGWFTAASGGTQITTTTTVPAGGATYHAQWSPNQYTITWDAQGGDSVSSTKHIYTNTLGTLPTTTRTGYTFDGWYTSATGGTKITSSTSVPAADTTYYAHWTANTYTITWDARGGTTVSNSSKTFGGTLGTLPSTTRTGYTFAGWYTAASGGTLISTTTAVPAANTTYYAHWTANTYTISWDSHGGTSVAATSKTYGGTFGTLPSTTRTGYTFKGWYTAASGGTKIETTTAIPAANLTYHAQWTANTYTITWNTHGGSSVSNSSLTYGGTLGTLPTTSRTGYTFTGWYTAESGGTKISDTTAVPAGNTTYHAQWSVNSYTVTFDSQGGTSISPVTKAYGSALGALPVPAKTGHTFVGWYTATTGGTQISATTTVPANNVTYYARWSVNSYTFSFDSCGGSAASSITRTYGAAFSSLPTTTRTGYTFAGWFTSASGGTQITTVSSVPAGNATYYAHWTANTYTISFDAHGGSTVAAQSKIYGNTLGTLPTSSLAGYTLAGWFTAATGGTQVTPSTPVPAGNTTYHAHWTANSYTINFDAQGGTSVSAQSKIYGGTLGTLPTTTRTGYTFLGWYTAPSGGSRISISTSVPLGGTTYYAQWSANSYTFTFDARGGTAVSQITRTYDTTFGTLPTTSRTGYTFDGWYTAASGGTKITTTTAVPAGSATYYAHWTANTYTISFDAHGGSAVSSQTKVYDTTLGTLPTTSRTGHTFLGWYTAASGGTKISSTTPVPAGNTTYHAQWEANTYTISFDAQGGSSVPDQSKTYTTLLGTLPATSRMGYTFVGWFTSPTSGTQVSSGTAVPAADTTYYAHWSVNTYTISFDVHGGSVVASQDKVYDTTLGTLPLSSRVGYTFQGWFTSATGGTRVTASTPVPPADTTYHAQWTANVYNISFDSRGGSAVATQQKTFDTILGTLPVTTRPGYTFLGWFTAPEGGSSVSAATAVPAADTTYYAQWSANTYTITWDWGDATGTSYQVFDDEIGVPADPVREFHYFDGWWTEETGGTRVATTGLYTTPSDVTYYAHWIQIFSVSIPSTLPVAIAEDGDTVSSSAIINNGSSGPVRVAEVLLEGLNGWTLTSFDTDMSSVKVDSKVLGFKIRDIETDCTCDAVNYIPSTEWLVPHASSLTLDYDAVFPAFSSLRTLEEVLKITFVIEWATP